MRRSLRLMRKKIPSKAPIYVILEDDDEEEDQEENEAEKEVAIVEPSPLPSPTTNCSTHIPTTSFSIEKSLSDEELLTSALKTRKDLIKPEYFMACPEYSTLGASEDGSKSTPSSRRVFKKVTFQLSEEFCQLSNLDVINQEIHKFQAPGARQAISGMDLRDVLNGNAALCFQSMQGSLAAAERLNSVLVEVEDARMHSNQLKRELEAERDAGNALRVEKKEWEAKQKEWEAEKEHMKAELSSNHSRIKELEERLKKRKTQLVDAAGFYTWKTKAKLMKEYLNGDTGKWTPQNDIHTFENVFGVKAPVVDENDDNIMEEGTNSAA